MFVLITAISLYCLAVGDTTCVKEIRACVKKKQENPLGRDDQYLDECIYNRELGK